MHKTLIFILTLGSFAFVKAAPPTPEEILKQERPESWPEWVDVEMDAAILTDETLKQSFKECFSKAPSLMLELSDDALFGEDGIYPKEADPKKEPTEAMVKATYWHPKKKGFSIVCGIRLQGSGSLTQSSKRNFRLRFAKTFGPGSLRYPLFKNDEAEEFENLLIRNPTHDSWTVKWYGWRKSPRYVNDRWALETARSLGHLAPRQEWVHLFINRIYWGVYALSERPDEHFAALHRKGKAEDFDVFNADELREGSEDLRKEAEQFLTKEFENTPEAFKKLNHYLDLSALIDHLICQIYQGKSDWPRKNYFLVGAKSGPPRFHFGPWDSEIGFYEEPIHAGANSQNALRHAPLSDPMFLSDPRGPSFWYRHLKSSEDFRLMFADRYHQLTKSGGALSVLEALNRYRKLLNEVTPLLLAESLRWGDARRKVPYLAHGPEWEQHNSAESWLFTQFFPMRSEALKQHLREEGIWPDLEPPASFTRRGKKLETKFYLKNSNQRGIIVFTTDGSDPRTPWTGKPRGNAFREPMFLKKGTTVKARILSHQKWSPLMIYQVP
jgi:hypothetical protein